MAVLARALMLAARVRRRLGAENPLPPYPDLFLSYARGRSFADVGAMWSVHGRYAFEAEAGGAAQVTAVDAMAETPEFLAEHRRRGSQVRFVRGDLTDPDLAQRVGEHDVVWSSGVAYHLPNPLVGIEHLGAMTRDVLLLQSATIPEVPGLSQACVFIPGLDRPEARAYGRVYPGSIALETPFDPSAGYANWWWAITSSALEAMVACQPDFEVVETVRGSLGTVVIARRIRVPAR